MQQNSYQKVPLKVLTLFTSNPDSHFFLCTDPSRCSMAKYSAADGRGFMHNFIMGTRRDGAKGVSGLGKALLFTALCTATYLLLSHINGGLRWSGINLYTSLFQIDEEEYPLRR